MVIVHSWRPTGDPTRVWMLLSYSWPAIHTEMFLDFLEDLHHPLHHQCHQHPLYLSGATQNQQFAEVSLRCLLKKNRSLFVSKNPQLVLHVYSYGIFVKARNFRLMEANQSVVRIDIHLLFSPCLSLNCLSLSLVVAPSTSMSISKKQCRVNLNGIFEFSNAMFVFKINPSMWPCTSGVVSLNSKV